MTGWFLVVASRAAAAAVEWQCSRAGLFRLAAAADISVEQEATLGNVSILQQQLSGPSHAAVQPLASGITQRN